MQLGLSDSPSDLAEASAWPGRFVALGGMAAKAYQATEDDRAQMVLALSVPHRGYVAALLASGWAITRRPDPPRSPDKIAAGVVVRVVTDKYVIVDELANDWAAGDPVALRRQSTWLPSHVRAVVPVEELAATGRIPKPEMGALASWAQMSARWESLIGFAADDLVLVGTKLWLYEDMKACVVRCHESGCDEPTESDAIAALLMPKRPDSKTWGSHVIPAARIDDHLPLPSQATCAVLDGASAIRNVPRVDCPIVFCVIDRSIADQSAAELLVQLRNTRGEPFSVADELGWNPMPGVEVTGFRLAL